MKKYLATFILSLFARVFTFAIMMGMYPKTLVEFKEIINHISDTYKVMLLRYKKLLEKVIKKTFGVKAEGSWL